MLLSDPEWRALKAAYVAEHAIAVPGPIREYYPTDSADTPNQDLWSARIGWPIFPDHTVTPASRQPVFNASRYG